MSAEVKGPGEESRELRQPLTELDLPTQSEKIGRRSRARKISVSFRQLREASQLCQPQLSSEYGLLLQVSELSFGACASPRGVALSVIEPQLSSASDKEVKSALLQRPFKFLIEKSIVVAVQDGGAPYLFLTNHGIKVLTALQIEKKLAKPEVPELYNLSDVFSKQCRTMSSGDLFFYHPVSVFVLKELVKGVKIKEVAEKQSALKTAAPLSFESMPTPVPIPAQPELIAAAAEPAPQKPKRSRLKLKAKEPEAQVKEEVIIKEKPLEIGADLAELPRLLLRLAFADDKFHLPTRKELLRELSMELGFEQATSKIHLDLVSMIKNGQAFVLLRVADVSEIVVPSPALLNSALNPKLKAAQRSEIKRVLVSGMLEPQNFFTRFQSLGELKLHPAYREHLAPWLQDSISKQIEQIQRAREQSAFEKRHAKIVFTPIVQGSTVELGTGESIRIGAKILSLDAVAPNSFAVIVNGIASAPLQSGKRWRVDIGLLEPKPGEPKVQAHFRVLGTALPPRESDLDLHYFKPKPRFKFELSTDPASLEMFRFSPPKSFGP